MRALRFVCSSVLTLLVSATAMAQEEQEPTTAPSDSATQELPALEPAPMAEPTTPAPSSAASAAPSATVNASHPAGAIDSRQGYAPPPMSRDMSRDFWQVHLGVRVGWVTSEGYDPFSENDGFSQVSMGATRAFVLSDSISFAPGLLWEYGNAASKARNAPTELSVHRLGAVAEGRLHLDRDLYVLAKLVPQAVYTGASIEEDSATAVLVRNAWRFGVDATAGAAWNFPRTLGVDDVVPQFWVVGEFGYGWSMNQDLAFSPDVDEDDPRASTTLDLGMLSMRGMMMRISVAMTF